jgi:hypothetical protein
MTEQDNAAAAEPQPIIIERLAVRPMCDVASALRRVVATAVYSDDAHFIYALAKIADHCGELSFRDFELLIQLPSNGDSQVRAFIRELQDRADDLESKLSEASDALEKCGVALAQCGAELARERANKPQS